MKFNFSENEILTKSQMNSIVGKGSCAATGVNANGDRIIIYTSSASQSQSVIAQMSQAGATSTNWCCESCGSASWYTPPPVQAPQDVLHA